MANFNQVNLMGNVVRDIELRYTKNQTAVTDMRMAVSDRVKRGEEWTEETTFVDVTLWGRTAEIAEKYLAKGSPVLVTGRLKMDEWETDGQKRSKLLVVANDLRLLGSKGESKSEPSKPAAKPQPVPTGEDIPF